MILKMFLELALLSFFLNGAEGQLSITPSVIEVEVNSPATLTCSYTGLSSPGLVYWLKNAVIVYSLQTSNCVPFGIIPDEDTFAYTCSNSKDFTWTFKAVSATQAGEKWSCGVNTSPQTDSLEVTIQIRVTTTAPPTTSSSTVGGDNPDPGPDNGAIIGGSVAAVVVIIIIVVVVIFVYKKGTPCASATSGAPENEQATKTGKGQEGHVPQGSQLQQQNQQHRSDGGGQKGVEEINKNSQSDIRPQPPLPAIGDNRNLRGLSANLEDGDMSNKKRLTPIGQESYAEYDEKPKKKKKKKKAGQDDDDVKESADL